MYSHKKEPAGFTLIELMVAIVILAIVSSIGLVTYENSQKLARDARRKSDLKQIEVALELYYEDNGHYPLTAPSACTDPPSAPCSIANDWANSDPGSSPTWPHWILNLSASYIDPMPIDPTNQAHNFIFDDSNGNSTADIYFYKTNSDTRCPGYGKWYALKATLENGNDPDTIGSLAAAGHPVTWCDGTTQIVPDNSVFMFKNQYLVVVKN